MTDFEFDLEAYLTRVGLSSVPPVDEDGLRALHRGHFYSIPFENFDIQLGRGIGLAPARLFEKLVRHSRGGYCFELNGLMLMALHALGFRARPLLARVHMDDGPPTGPTHQFSLVELGARMWVMDVGFGAGGPCGPLPLEIGGEEHIGERAFRFQQRDPWGTLLQTREGGEWKDSYSFDQGLVTPADIAVSNHYTASAPGSRFVVNRIASVPRARGRISLLNFTQTEIEGERKVTREIEPGQVYLDVLKDDFGIDLDVSYDELL